MELSWSDTGVKVRDFIPELIALRADYPVLCRKNFLTGKLLGLGFPTDVFWWSAKGREMTEADWDFGCFGMQLIGGVLNENDELGHPRKSDTVFLERS